MPVRSSAPAAFDVLAVMMWRMPRAAFLTWTCGRVSVRSPAAVGFDVSGMMAWKMPVRAFQRWACGPMPIPVMMPSGISAARAVVC
jgi:hypothetical protein